jgi:hypothetical protein
MARGRKSSVSLAVVPPALPGERPAPPAELDAAEARIWTAIVGALPLARRRLPNSTPPRPASGLRSSAPCRRPGSTPPPRRSWSGWSRRLVFARAWSRSCAKSAGGRIRI